MDYINPKNLYVRKMDKYDSEMLKHVYLKKNNKFINLKSEQVDKDVSIEELVKMVNNDAEFGKLSINDLKYILARFVKKPNEDQAYEVRRANSHENIDMYLTLSINPYHELFTKYRSFITNSIELDRLRNVGKGSVKIYGLVAIDQNINHIVEANFNKESANEPLSNYFTRKIKSLAPVKRFGFFK